MQDAAAEFAREARKCPSCGALARVEPHRVLRFACAACGAPRSPLAGGDESPSLAPAMHAVRGARAAAMGWRAGGGVLVAAGVMAMGLGALLVGVAHGAAFLLFAFGGVFLGGAMMAARRGRAAERAAAAKLEEMWEGFAVAAVRAAGGGATAAELSRALRIDEGYAERLLVGISVKGRVAQELGEDAELRYRVEGAPRVEAAEGRARVEGVAAARVGGGAEAVEDEGAREEGEEDAGTGGARGRRRARGGPAEGG